MKKILILMILSVHFGYSQTYMNIYQNNGTTTNIDISTIDSIKFTTINNGLTISTNSINSISALSAIGGATITNVSGSNITNKGICFSTSSNPTTASTVISVGTGNSNFTVSLSNLNPNTTYFVRAFAINSNGTFYGNEISFTTLSLYVNGGGVTDIDGNFYPTIIISGQEWTKVNLKTTKYANGDVIANGTGVGGLVNVPTPKYWFAFDDDINNVTEYGRLYTWDVAGDSRNVCPSGFHVPSANEWDTLISNIGGNYHAIRLKESGFTHWDQSSLPGDNSSGFTALGAGMRESDGDFQDLSYLCNWWSSDEVTNNPLGGKSVWLDTSYVINVDGTYKKYGFSIRCVKN